MRVADLPTPSLLLDLDVLERNVGWMARRCAELGVALRPHLKTHKCVEIAERQRAAGARGVTVSTLSEAEVFAGHGFDDITWAFPLILGRLDQVAELGRRITLRVLVDSEEAVAALEGLGEPLHVWLKIDCGYHRAGVDPDSDLALELARRLDLSSHLTFDGVLTHSGHAYHVTGRRRLAAVAEQERSVMHGCAERLRGAGVRVDGVSVGSTPAMRAVEHLEGVTEARPGNYVLFDGMQAALGSCGFADVAVSVLASVVSSQPGASHSVVDAGALALSKDPGIEAPGMDAAGRRGTGMGLVADGRGRLRPHVKLTGLSQEHGLLSVRMPVGERVRILPNHSCLTVACFDEFQVVRGDRVVDRWRIRRARGLGR